jgi:TonB family protein
MRSIEPRGLGLVPLMALLGALAGAQEAPDANQRLRDLSLAGPAEAVRALLSEAEPDLDAADENGWTALMYAIEGDQEEIVELLLEAGAGVDQRNGSGETPLHLAARYGRTAAAAAVLGAGADFRLKDSEGRTPLYRAIETRRADIIEMLQGAALAQGRGALSQTTSDSPLQAVPPTVVESKKAPYTDSARAQGIEGTVVLMALVRRDGSVGAVSVSEGLEASLDRRAVEAVKDWKFAPAMRNGKTVEMVIEVDMEFRLDAEPEG